MHRASAATAAIVKVFAMVQRFMTIFAFKLTAFWEGITCRFSFRCAADRIVAAMGR
jgi:hypothetical protein